MSEPILQAMRIVKRFPGVLALGRVSFDVCPGEIHALCGENGAGKSTLIKVLSGLHPYGSYEGDLKVDGRVVQLRSISDARALGISVIYQELSLAGEMSVAENIFLGRQPVKNGLLQWSEMSRRASELLSRFRVEIDPDTPVRHLGIGQQQLIEIAKALGTNDARVLILDEPTAALSEQEVAHLLEILRDLRMQGIAILYISHKLDEVFAISDRITVLRDGQSVFTADAAVTGQAEIVRQMVGRELGDFFPRHTPELGEPVLTVKDLTIERPEDGKVLLRDVSFTVRAGEVLGIGGLMGAGRTELLTHLFGVWGRRTHGTVALAGRDLLAGDPSGAVRAGLVLVSEDRKRYGLVLDQTIGFNLSLSSLGRITSGMLVDRDREFVRSLEVFQSLGVKANNMEVVVSKLSGGNQQKVVIGKALLADPKVIFLDEPTRGIDVGAKVEVYEIINKLTAQGKAVVLVSSELPELLNMSDRIIMLHEGVVAGEFPASEATQEKLMTAAMGQLE